MEETDLVQSASQGDLNAFNQLVLAHQQAAFNVAFHMLYDESAEDITQNAFIAAYRGLDRFWGGSFRTWLLRIVTNKCYDEVRRRKSHPHLPLECTDEDGEEIDSPAWLVDAGPTPEESLERKELRQALSACLAGLREEYRLAVVLVDLQGLDYLEASRALGVPVGTVKSRLARGRARLREAFCSSRYESVASFQVVRAPLPAMN
jgi:RNA polymerase sigma-70 factor (ECF subfamily)